MPRAKRVRVTYEGAAAVVSVPTLGIHAAERGKPVTVPSTVADRLPADWQRVKPRHRTRGEE